MFNKFFAKRAKKKLIKELNCMLKDIRDVHKMTYGLCDNASSKLEREFEAIRYVINQLEEELK